MTSTKAIAEKTTDLRLKMPEDLKGMIRRFRAKKQMADQPITSDAKAIIHLLYKSRELQNA